MTDTLDLGNVTVSSKVNKSRFSLTQEFLTLALATFGARDFLVSEGCPGPSLQDVLQASLAFNLLDASSSLFLPPVLATKNVFRYCQMSPGGKIALD